MATTTPNIGLTLPVGTEKVSRQIINQNMSKIDEKVGAVPNGQDLQSQVTSLSDQMANKVYVYQGELETESLTGNTDNNINLSLSPITTFTKLAGIAFIGNQPISSWDTDLITWQYLYASETSVTISGRTKGTTAQKYKIRYLLFYKD